MTWLPKKSVVVPVDFSEPSLAAVETALDFVASPKDINVIHVLPTLSPAEPGMIWEVLNDESRCDSAEANLRNRLSGPKFEQIRVKSTVGDPGQKIVDFASQVEAELIIMPSHGRTGLKRLLIGSVAERVVRLASCPVLVLRE